MTLTIFIPSKNRPALLRRAIKFWSKYEFNILIVDGSDKSQYKWVKKFISEKFVYIHKKSSFPVQLGIAANSIQTKYCILSSDDCYYIPSALRQCVHFLDQNPEYAAVHGRAINFIPNRNKIRYSLDAYQNWLGRELIEDNAKDRLVKHMGNYSCNLTFAVARSTPWKESALIYSKNEMPLYAQSELQLNMILSFMGKSTCFQRIMLIISSGESNAIRNNVPSLSYSNMIWNFWSNNENFLKDKWLKVMTNSIYKILPQKISKAEISAAIVLAVQAYCLKAKKNGLIIDKNLNLFLKLRKKLSNLIVHYFKKSLKKLKFYTFTTDPEKFYKKLENEGILIDKKEFAEVVSSIKEFHKS